MAPHPIFLSLILVSSDNREFLGEWLKSASSVLEPLVEDYEIVIVDNGSSDGSLDRLRELISGPGIPNVQVYGLVQKVERDLAVTVGIENALGDYVAVIDPVTDSFSMLPKMLDKILAGHDVVFALNRQAAEQSLSYRLLSGL